MKKKIKDYHISALSNITGIEKQTLEKCIDHRLLDLKGVRALLIREEYKQYLTEGIQTKSSIVLHLMDKYKLSKSSVEKIIYSYSPKKKKERKNDKSQRQ